MAAIPTLYYWLFAAALLLGGGLWLWVTKVRPWLAKVRAYALDCSRCGFLPPPPTPRAVRILQRIARVLLWWQVGPIKFIGLENAQGPGPRIITPNHGSAADPAVFSQAFDEPLRYMAAGGVFEFAHGLGSLIVGRMGAFCADLNPGKGGPAKGAAVKALTTGQSVVMFPEGWAWLDGVVERFKTGAVRIAKESASQLGQPVQLVPVYMRYGTYPGSWIRKYSSPVQFLIMLVFSPLFWRRGLTVVFGKPISSADLPEDDHEATNMLREAVLAVDPRKGHPPFPTVLP